MPEETMNNYWIICPYCLYEHEAPWEWDLVDYEPDEDDELYHINSHNCENCDKVFIAYKHEIFQYYAKPYIKKECV